MAKKASKKPKSSRNAAGDPYPVDGNGRPKAPAHLSVTSRRIWARFQEGWKFDLEALVILENSLVMLDRAGKARALIDKQGLLVGGQRGQRAHPACDIERASMAACNRGLRMLGLQLEPLHDMPGRPVS